MSDTQKILLASFASLLIALTSPWLLLASHMWDPSWNPFGMSAEEILLRSIEKTSDLESFRTLTAIQGEVFQGAEKIIGISLTTTGDTQKGAEEQNFQGEISADIQFEGIEISFSAEYRATEDTVYVKINTFPALSYIQALLGADISNIKDGWIRIDKEDLREFGVLQEEGTQEKQELFTKKVEQLMAEGRAFASIEKLGTEQIRGISSSHLRIVLYNEALREIIEFAVSTLEPNDQEDINALSELVTPLGDIPIDIWIGKQDTLPRRILVYLELKDAEIFQQFPIQDPRVTVSIQIDFSDFNQMVAVRATENSSSLEEVFETLFGSAFGEVRSSARDARRKADIRQIQILEELYYSDNGSYSITPVSLRSISSSLPRDPGGGVCEDYQWISNVGNPQSYCVYACLEDGRFFVASKRGTFTYPVPPSSLEECES